MKNKLWLLAPAIIFILVVGYFLFGSIRNKKQTVIQPDLNNPEMPIVENEENPKPEEIVEITFVGDIMVDRFIRRIAERNSYDYLFDHVRDILNQSDLVVANLEGPVTNFLSISNSVIPHERFVFTFDPMIVNALLKANIKIVNIDNNHMLDFGREGLIQTRKHLSESTLEYFGDPDNRKVLYKNFGNITLGFVSFNQFIKQDVNEALNLIQKARDLADHIIVYTHWGDEYEIEPNRHQIRLAHQFIDAGADLIIGSHPHVVQHKEIYKNRKIYYSLGNFIFDQYFSEEVSCGAVVTFEFSKHDIKLVSEKFVKLDSKNVVQFSECHSKIIKR